MTPGDPGFNPFPGLRPFDMDEEYLFFGREDQHKELVSLLREQRFVAVLGASGSGKSSLVRAGLLPALYGGVMTKAGSNWHIALMRPGGHAITNLAEALFETDLLDNEVCEDLTELDIEATLIRSSLGLIEVARQLGLQQNENLLIVVDQFEELFRFNSSQSDRSSRDEAAAFVKMLVEAGIQQELSIYVVLTMRSDFFGDCSQFEELAEAVNKGEYLVPRLNRENKKTAIEGPVRVGGGDISPRLVQRLLNDLGDDPDQLPIMQHALMRTWDCWLSDHDENEPLDLRHYEATGGMDEALSRHADEAHAEATTEEEQRLTRQLFQALTEKGADNRGIRRPTPLKELCEISGANKDQVSSIIDRFRKPGRTFLMPPIDRELEDNTVIDISHESLMRVWASLGRWVDDEGQSARIYRRLAETAQLHADGSAGLYHDPDLQIALSWRDTENPTEAWGQRYHPEYSQSIGFLGQSHEVKLKEQRAEEVARERELVQAKRLAKAEQERAEAQQQLAVKQRKRAKIAAVLAGLALIATAVAGVAWNESQKSEVLAKQAQKTAEENASKAAEAQQAAETSEDLARKSQKSAEEASTNLSKALTESDFITGTEYLDSGKTPEGLAYLARAMRRDPTFWPATMRAMSVLENQNFSLDQRPVLEHDRPAQGPIVSKDESRILTYVATGDVRVWDPETGKLISEFGDDTFSTEISSDGKIAAIQDSKNRLNLWNTNNGTRIGEIKPEQGVRTFTFARHKKGDYIATFNVSGSLQLWSLNGSEHTPPLKTKGNYSGTRHSKPGITKDGKRIYGLFTDGHFACWDIKTGSEVCPPFAHELQSPFAVVSDKGEWAALGTRDGKSIRWWNLNTSNSPLSEPIQFQRPINNVEFTSDAKRLFAGGPGNNGYSYSMLNLTTGKRLYEEKVDLPGLWANRNMKNGKLLIISDPNNLKIIDLKTGKTETELSRQEESMTMAFFTDYGDRFAVIHNNSTIRIRDSKSGASTTKPLKHDENVNSLRFNNTGTLLASNDGAYGIRIWNALSGDLISGPLKHTAFASIQFGAQPFLNKHNTLVTHDYGYTGSSQGNILTTGKARLWNTSTRTTLDTLLEKGAFEAEEFTSDNNNLITIKEATLNKSNQQTLIFDIQLWDIATHVEKSSMSYTNSVTSFESHQTLGYAFLPDTNKTVNVLDTKTLQLHGKLKHPSRIKPYFLATAKNAPILSVPTVDLTFHLWDIVSGEKINEIKTKQASKYSSLSDDGSLICTFGGDDYEALVWDTKSGEQIAGPFKHENVIFGAFFSAINENQLITLSGDKTIKLWDTSDNQLIHSFDDIMWPTGADFNENLLMTSGSGNSAYPSAIRLWDITNLRSKITPIQYEGSIVRARLMRNNELVGAKDNKGNLRIWDTQLGRPLTNAKKNVQGTVFSGKNHFVTESPSGLRLHSLPEKVEQCPEWLPNLLESLGGKSVNKENIFVNVPKERLGQNLKSLSKLSGDSQINRWGQWFASTDKSRTISPYSKQTTKSYLEMLGKSERAQDLRQALIHQPGNSLAKSRLSIAQRRTPNLRHETPDKAFDNNKNTRHIQHKTIDVGLVIKTKKETITGITFTTSNNLPSRDPVLFTLFGANSPSNVFTEITTQNIPLINKRKSITTLKINNSHTYDTYRIVLREVRDSKTTPGMQIAEIELLNSSGEDITSPDDEVSLFLGEDLHLSGLNESLAREAAEKLPDNPEIAWTLADVLDGVGKSKEAKEQINHALALAPNDPNVLFVNAFIERDNKEQSRMLFAKSIDSITSPGKPNVVLHPLLRKVDQLENKSPKELSSLSIDMIKNKPWGDDVLFAIWLARYATLKDPDNIEVARDYSEVLNNTGNNTEAAIVLKKVIETAPENPLFWISLGYINDAAEHYQAALNNLQKAIDLLKMNDAESLKLRSEAHMKRANILKNNLKQPVIAHRERTKALIPPRAEETPTNLIDLSSHYTAPIRGMGQIGNYIVMSDLPLGQNKFHGEEYDTRGIIKLSGIQQDRSQGSSNPYPKKAEGIIVNQKLNSLKFLQAVSWTDPDGTPVANYSINYEDGTNVVIPVIYGVHLRDWFQSERNRNLKTPKAEIVYRGRTGSFSYGLYQQFWANPHPAKTIKTIDVLGQNSFSNFFLVGMTGESLSAEKKHEGEKPSNENQLSPQE